MRKQYTTEQRDQLINSVRVSGERPASAAKRLGVSPATAYHWLKQAPRGAVFAQVIPTASSSVATTEGRPLMIQVGAATIRVEPGFDAELLRAVVNALRVAT